MYMQMLTTYWSVGCITDANNFLDHTTHTSTGWLFFQCFKNRAAAGGAAVHDNNMAHRNTAADSGGL
jgi:hypothetical protein